MKKLEFITILYGIAPILVILGHSHPLHCAYPWWLGQVTAFIYIFHMPLFFIIAGILLDYTSGKVSVIEWWLSKVKKLIVPYVALTAIAWMPKVMLGRYMNDNMEMSGLNFIKILLAPRAGIWGHFWFIPV